MGRPDIQRDAEKHAYGYATYEDNAPPPPAYSALSSHAMKSAAPTTTIPPTLNCYPPKLNRKAVLGLTKDQPLVGLELHRAHVWNEKPMVTLHDGPSENDGILATVHKENGLLQKFRVAVPARGSQSNDVVVNVSRNSLSDRSFKFSVPVGDKIEEFEWRHSSGKEIKDMADASWGWKLARLSGPNTKPGGSSTAERELGFASDGREIVAIIAAAPSIRLYKEFRFSLIGSGLTGTLGSTWEIVTLATAVKLWWTRHLNNRRAVAAATAA